MRIADHGSLNILTRLSGGPMPDQLTASMSHLVNHQLNSRNDSIAR